jgi:hypothetical protein
LAQPLVLALQLGQFVQVGFGSATAAKGTSAIRIEKRGPLVETVARDA